MFRYSWRLAQAAQPISRHEFLDALREVCPAATSLKHDGRLPLALAVSGGVDSMALALMCREYMPENGTTLHALVVDHGLRPSSREEAIRVQQTLKRRLNINARILYLALQESSMTEANIETFARMMRYRALGHACKGLKSATLLVGHHYDDQAETVLSRLATGHTKMLRGIRKISNIPECHGLHGISESGKFLPLSFTKLPPCFGVSGIEQGGVHIIRPLLNFSKNRLIATCQKYGMSWIEDETNKDKSLTPRNAIRHMLQSHHLPEALSSRSLVQLSKSKQQSEETVRELVNTLFDRMPLSLDLRSSVIAVQFPELNIATIGETLLPGGLNFERGYTIAQMLIHRVASLVSPGEHLPLGSFNFAAEHIFNIYHNNAKFSSSSQSRISTNDGLKSSFVASGVLFDHISNPNKNEEVTMGWRLSRAPIIASQSFKITQWIPPASEIKSNREEVFDLWDGRYWIQVHNPSKHDLWVRPLDETGLSSLRLLLAERKVVLRPSRGRKGVSYSVNNHLDQLLRDIAPAKTRWTLPVIVSGPPLLMEGTIDGEVRTPASKILAFPTLGLRVEHLDDESWPEWVTDLTWEVRYKKIDLGTKRLEDCLVDYGC